VSGRLAGRFILLGVTGSIAAYKAVELLRLMASEGAEVQVLMTEASTHFVGPLTFETLSRRPVVRDPLALLPDQHIAHVAAGERADAIVVAPATARWLSAMAGGLADDVITITCLAARAPVVVAPAMDGEMYAHPATRANVERLRGFGYHIVEPAVGLLASGASGRGRLAEPATILEAVVGAIVEPIGGRRRDLEGRRILVTAGGTAEPIDPVRFIGNRSSGRMGVAVAEAALERGATVDLVAGTTAVPLPASASVTRVTTAAEMRETVLSALPGADALVMAAAVADFRPRDVADGKLERSGSLVLELHATNDILAEAVRAAEERTAQGDARRPVIVGFAAETGSLARAPAKARRKGVDLLVANDVTEPGSGFDVDTNRVTLIAPGSAPEPWPLLPKREVAHRLLDRVATLLETR
jgi:phosphopantothenoylcysteine decarboxylase / phosphopantothenate---cysteine ligase